MNDNGQSTPQILPNRNPKYGFYGECKTANAPADLYWSLTSEFLITNLQLSPEDTRTYLESRIGRWLADDLFGNAPENAVFNVYHLRQYLAAKGLSSHWKAAALEDVRILKQEIAGLPDGQVPTREHE